jgi:signal transduction histidine kinase
MFIEPSLLAGPKPVGSAREWTLKVKPLHNSALLAAPRDARRTWLMLTASAVLAVLALLLTIRAVRSAVALASMKSEFVSAVTHELKTPVALIGLIGDTLTNRRYTSGEAIQDYARLLSQEAKRLGQTVDTLLTYARYSDPLSQAHLPRVPVQLSDLVEDALESFRPTLQHGGFELTVDIPSDLRVLADRNSLIQVVECVVDNAIKYSRDRREITIKGRLNRAEVHLTIADRGRGIDQDDLDHVFDRFYRGRNARESGSGLGLAIARSIVGYHRGQISVRSELEIGTEIELVLNRA